MDREVRHEVTIDDPRTNERPWTAVFDLAAQGSIFEYDCHEGNRVPAEHPPYCEARGQAAASKR